jgi:hypothetical protein
VAAARRRRRRVGRCGGRERQRRRRQWRDDDVHGAAGPTTTTIAATTSTIGASTFDDSRPGDRWRHRIGDRAARSRRSWAGRRLATSRRRRQRQLRDPEPAAGSYNIEFRAQDYDLSPAQTIA